MKSKRSFDRLTSWGLWILIVVFAMSLARNLSQARKVRHEVAAERVALAKIQADNERLQEELVKTQSPQFLEKEVRNKLGLIKEGELVVVLPDAEILRKLAPKIPEEAEALPDPNWRKWLKLFI